MLAIMMAKKALFINSHS